MILVHDQLMQQGKGNFRKMTMKQPWWGACSQTEAGRRTNTVDADPAPRGKRRISKEVFRFSSDAAACQFFARPHLFSVTPPPLPPARSMPPPHPPPHSIHNRGRRPSDLPAHRSRPRIQPGTCLARARCAATLGFAPRGKRHVRDLSQASLAPRKPRRLEQPGDGACQAVNRAPSKWPRGHGDSEG